MKKKSPRKFVTPTFDDPVALARQAMGAALAKVVAGGDPTQIIEMSQRVIGALSKPAAAPGDAPKVDASWLDWSTADEMNDLDAMFRRGDEIKAAATARREAGGDKPKWFRVDQADGSAICRDTPESEEERRARYREQYGVGGPVPMAAPPPLVEPEPAPDPDDEIVTIQVHRNGVMVPETMTRHEMKARGWKYVEELR